MGLTGSGDPPADPELHGIVLYIEDDLSNYEVVEALLSPHPGVRLLRAATGRGGVELARTEQPDAILLDMHLPDISGVEVVRLLSQDIAAGSFRVVLLTADRLNIDVLKALSLGAVEYVLKPAEADALLPALARALSGKGGGSRPVPRPS